MAGRPDLVRLRSCPAAKAGPGGVADGEGRVPRREIERGAGLRVNAARDLVVGGVPRPWRSGAVWTTAPFSPAGADFTTASSPPRLGAP